MAHPLGERIGEWQIEVLKPGMPHIVCGNPACHLINPPGFEANCKWCGFYLAATGGISRLLTR